MINKSKYINLIIIFGLTLTGTILVNNLIVNLINNNIGLNFTWLNQTSGFAISESLVPFKPSDSYIWALFAGWVNSLRVIVISLIIATLLGLTVGLLRFSNNLLLRFCANTYIAIVRQVPLLIQLLFWYFVALLGLKDKRIDILFSKIIISNQSISLFGINMSVEFAAIMIGLSIFTAASIAEVVRGGIESIPKGQFEAYQSLGISNSTGMKIIILPQSLPAIIPALTSQYLNLAKNSTLAIAIGYSDIYAISDTVITQTGRAVEGFILLLIGFLFLNLIISNLMELINTFILNFQRH